MTWNKNNKESNKFTNDFLFLLIVAIILRYISIFKQDHPRLINIIKRKPKAIVILPELSTYNYQDRA